MPSIRAKHASSSSSDQSEQQIYINRAVPCMPLRGSCQSSGVWFQHTYNGQADLVESDSLCNELTASCLESSQAGMLMQRARKLEGSEE